MTKELHVVVVRRIETYRLMVETPAARPGEAPHRDALALAKNVIRQDCEMRRINPGVGRTEGVVFLGEAYEADWIMFKEIDEPRPVEPIRTPGLAE